MADIPKKFCTQCGSENPAQFRFCNSCGAPAASLPATNQATAPSPPPPPPAPPAPPLWQSPPPQAIPVQSAPPAYPSQPPGPPGYAQQQPPDDLPANPDSRPPSSSLGKRLVLMLLVVLVAAGGFGAVRYFGSNGTIALPWGDKPNPDLYTGTWRAVSREVNGKNESDVFKDRKVDLHIVKNSDKSLSGKLVVSASSYHNVDLKPDKAGNKYVGYSRPTWNTTVYGATLEFETSSKNLLMTLSLPSAPTYVYHFVQVSK